MPQALINMATEYDVRTDTLEEVNVHPHRAHSVRRRYMGGIRTKRELEMLNKLRNKLHREKICFDIIQPPPTWTCFFCKKIYASKNALRKHRKKTKHPIL